LRPLPSSPLARRLSVLQAHLPPPPPPPPSPMADEKEAAREAAAHHAKEHAEAGEPTIFDKIISKQIPSKVVFEDDSVLAFRDISPQGPTHIILIPKARDGLTQLAKAEDRHEQILGHLLVTAAKVARQEKLDQGFRLVINDGPHGCQSVYHIHLHLIGGRQMNWPPG
jgi:diadenosine tetraphosphate (Ap4A) HIT family hydrolase